MAKSSKITKQQMLSDLQRVLYTNIAEFNRIYGGSSALALVEGKTGNVFRFNDVNDDALVRSLNIGDMRATELLSQIYDYAVDGRLDKQLEGDFIEVCEDIIPFFEDMDDSQLIRGNVFPEDYPIGSILEIIEIFHARHKLDFGISFDEFEVAHMPLKQVAILAGIDEKTARNLAHPNAKNRLVTVNREGRTYVDKEFARQWLIQRGFNETVEFDSSLDRDLAKRGFWSLGDLGDFVRGHREKAGLSQEDLIKSGGGGIDLDWLVALEAGRGTFERDRLLSLAKVLALPDAAFVLAAYDIFHSVRRFALANELQALDLHNAQLRS
jgi:Helix-turn-helix domain